MRGIRTRGHRMVGTDETTELWRPPHLILVVLFVNNKLSSLAINMKIFEGNTDPSFKASRLFGWTVSKPNLPSPVRILIMVRSD